MLNNVYLNEYLRNCRNKCCFNSSQGQFLTPCDALNKYINDPCSIFNITVVPTGSVPLNPIVPVLPPLPMPPFPVGPMIGSRALFRAPTNLLTSGDDYMWNTELLEGDAIEHVDGSISISLKPNTTFEYSFISLTTNRMDEEIQAGAVLLLAEDGTPRDIGFNFVMGNGLNNIMVEISRRFTTRNAPVTFNITFALFSASRQGFTEATLMLAEIL